MSGVDTRYINRDSLFLMADVRLDGDSASHRVKVRNLSAGGMMAESDMAVVRGARVTVELRNLPSIAGSVTISTSSENTTASGVTISSLRVSAMF